MLSQKKKKKKLESKSGKLDVPKEELENNLRLTYSDDLNVILIPPLRDLPKPQDPMVMFDDSGIKLKEVRDFIHKVCVGSSPGLNGGRPMVFGYQRKCSQEVSQMFDKYPS